MNSKENFEIKITFKDKDGKIIKFIKKVDLEVDWKEKRTKTPQEVVFKKDGEEYRIIIKKLEIFKGWLKKRIVSDSLGLPPNISYNTYHGEPSSDGRIKTSGQEEDDYFYIKFTNPWRMEIIITFSIIVIIAIISILFLWSWWKKRRK